ncbi:hypothetical protein HMI54_008499, partial [Coelomomyces lativittatus]
EKNQNGTPAQFLKDAPEIIPIAAASAFACGLAAYALGKKLLLDKDVVVFKGPPETWQDHSERLKKKGV